MSLANLTGRLAVAELELEAKGHEPRQAQAAVRRALGLAQRGAERLRPAIRDAAFEDLLAAELAGAEAWLQGVAAARARGDYEEGMERAVRDGRWERGMERFGVTPGPERTQAWRGSVDEAVDAWGSR